MMTYKHSHITDLIIKAFFTVYNKLGYGFLEKVYENAMLIELRKLGLNVINQKGIKVYYDEFQVGYYSADLLVEESVIVELKAGELLCEENEAQLVNYLKATNIEVGLLMNFGKTAQFKRKIFDNDYKKVKLTDTDSMDK
jgi:GxxExxY protein